MNNEAFQSLVNRTRKTTKEIAREAVEDEFKKKRRHRDSDGYGSDSGSDDDRPSRVENVKAEPEWKKRRREKKEEVEGVEYRDRARERREGRTVEYEGVVGMKRGEEETAEERQRQIELSKYLGGDEEHTHLVRGLDLALAQKVRREEMGEDWDGFMERALEAKPQPGDAAGKKSGVELLGYRIEVKSDLGASLLSYLLKKQEGLKRTSSASGAQVQINPALQRSIQRSVLSFSLESDVRRRKHAFDAPLVSIRAICNQVSNIVPRRETPLDPQMLLAISSKLSGNGFKKERKTMREEYISNGGADHIVSSVDDMKDRPDTKDQVNDSLKDADSDDDIFENAGTYIPPSAAIPKNDTLAQNGSTSHSINEPSEPSANQTKQSIFDNLLPEDAPPTHTRHAPLQGRLPRFIDQGKNVVNRDVIGASSNDQSYMKRRGPQTAALEGFSMNNYEGYGEEMDVDFGNFDEHDRSKRKYKKDGKGKTGGGQKNGEENDF